MLEDWLVGCHTAPTLDEALDRRAQLAPGSAIYVPQGHCVTAHSVGFYAQDSEQSGLLARAQEIEHLDKELRAQALIGEEARTALVRAEAAYADATQRLATLGREAAEAQSRAHELQVEHLRQSQLAEQARARSEQIGADLAEVQAQLDDLQERRVAAEARFEELDMQLADSQERHAQLGDRVIEAERRLQECREQQRSLERQAQEATFSQRSLEARRAELSRTLDTAAQQTQALQDERQRAQGELERLSDAAAQGGLQQVLELKLQREYSDLQILARDAQEQLKRKEASLMKPINVDLDKVINDYAQKNGIDVVLNSSDPAVLKSSDRLDITVKILDEYNRYSQSGAKQGAAKPQAKKKK